MKRIVCIGIALLLLLAAAGCTPTPAPSPTGKPAASPSIALSPAASTVPSAAPSTAPGTTGATGTPGATGGTGTGGNAGGTGTGTIPNFKTGTEVKEADVPEITQALLAKYQGAKITRITQGMQGTQQVYVVEYTTKDGKKETAYIAPGGAFVTPAPGGASSAKPGASTSPKASTKPAASTSPKA